MGLTWLMQQFHDRFDDKWDLRGGYQNEILLLQKTSHLSSKFQESRICHISWLLPRHTAHKNGKMLWKVLAVHLTHKHISGMEFSKYIPPICAALDLNFHEIFTLTNLTHYKSLTPFSRTQKTLHSDPANSSQAQLLGGCYGKFGLFDKLSSSPVNFVKLYFR